MAAQIFEPPVDDFWIRIPGLDRALVYTTFKILLRFLVHEGTSEDGPQCAFCREGAYT